MKWLSLLCMLLFSPAAFADDSAAAPIPLKQPPPKVQIINGKRFFSLQNVRRFNGDTNNPKALSVIHHPRTERSFIPHGGAGRLPATPPSTGVNAAGTGTPGMDKPASDQVLSIFAPEDKRATAPATTK